MTLRIVLADDSLLLREGIARLIVGARLGSPVFLSMED